MRLLPALRVLSALTFILTGVIIAGNDLFLGYRSTLPVVSAIVSLIFIGAGVFVWGIGGRVAKLSPWIQPEGQRIYAWLCVYMNTLFIFFVLIGIGLLTGVISRIDEGFAIFG